MQIAIASGKGGTGKTTVATNLAYFLREYEQKNVTLIDCDVEEPNSHLFFNPIWQTSEKITVPVPIVNHDNCTGCGKCADICEFNAIACIKGKVLVFPELCHGCGGCVLVCPEGAITEGEREIGYAEAGESNGLKIKHGRLRVGEAMSPPLIKAVRGSISKDELVLIDCPPGTSCPVIQAIRDCDFVLLITEPTPFGLNDLKLAVEMVRELGLPFAVGINRSTIGDRAVWDYCAEENIPIILEIPNDRQIAEAYSRGKLLLQVLPHYKKNFANLFEYLKGVVAC